MPDNIKLGHLSAIIEKQILEILSEESPLYSHQIDYRIVPQQGYGLVLPLSNLVNWSLINVTEKPIQNRIQKVRVYHITEKGKQFIKQLKGE